MGSIPLSFACGLDDRMVHLAVERLMHQALIEKAMPVDELFAPVSGIKSQILDSRRVSVTVCSDDALHNFLLFTRFEQLLLGRLISTRLSVMEAMPQLGWRKGRRDCIALGGRNVFARLLRDSRHPDVRLGTCKAYVILQK